MKLVAGVDIGNSTTEVCIGELDVHGEIRFLSSASCSTTGTKGTVVNVHGIEAALKDAMGKIGKNISEMTASEPFPESGFIIKSGAISLGTPSFSKKGEMAVSSFSFKPLAVNNSDRIIIVAI